MNVDKLLAMALEHSSADQTEASISLGTSALTRFANSTIHQNMLFENGEIKIRAVFGKKVAEGTSNRLDEEGVRSLVDSVVEMARLQDEKKDFVSLPKQSAPIRCKTGY
jgi:predicted Zn-dependent protease